MTGVIVPASCAHRPCFGNPCFSACIASCAACLIDFLDTIYAFFILLVAREEGWLGRWQGWDKGRNR